MLGKKTKITTILALLFTFLILFSFTNSILIFEKSTKKSSINKTVGKSIGITALSPKTYTHSIELELSKTKLSLNIEKQLPTKSCLISYSDSSTHPIISYNPTEQLIPASTMKMLTADIVFSNFNKDDTLDTSLYGNISNGTVKSAILTTSGDPSFVTEDKPNIGRLDYLENKFTHKFNELAAAVSSKKITKIETLNIDTSWFELKPYNEEWKDKKSQIGALGAILVNEGFTEEGVSSEPSIDASEKLKIAFASNSVTIDEIIFSTQEPKDENISEVNLIASAKSATIENLVSDMLKNSNNVYAEQLLIAAAHKSINIVNTDTLKKFIDDSVKKIFTDSNGIKYLNASGFSYSSTISCMQHTEIINDAISNKVDLIALTSKAHEDGTLTERLSAYEGILQAKTGTLIGVTGLVGRLNNYIFVLMVNGQFNDDQGHIYQEKTIELLNQFPEVKDLKL